MTTEGIISNREIHIHFVKEGVHCYPAAATDPKLATGEWDDVSFLAAPHFHYFYFYVSVQVYQNDRDIEFIQFRRWCERQYDQGALQVGSKSCEMLAEELIDKIKAQYPNRDIKVSVLEDDINGATLTYTKPVLTFPQNFSVALDALVSSNVLAGVSSAPGIGNSAPAPVAFASQHTLSDAVGGGGGAASGCESTVVCVSSNAGEPGFGGGGCRGTYTFPYKVDDLTGTAKEIEKPEDE